MVAIEECKLAGRSQERERVDARVLAKAPVLVGEQQVEVAGINIIRMSREDANALPQS